MLLRAMLVTWALELLIACATRPLLAAAENARGVAFGAPGIDCIVPRGRIAYDARIATGEAICQCND
jgi:hypothetical protein